MYCFISNKMLCYRPKHIGFPNFYNSNLLWSGKNRLKITSLNTKPGWATLKSVKKIAAKLSATELLEDICLNMIWEQDRNWEIISLQYKDVWVQWLQLPQIADQWINWFSQVTVNVISLECSIDCSNSWLYWFQNKQSPLKI